MLQDMSHDAKSNAGCASGDDVDLKIDSSATAHARELGTGERRTLPERSGMSLLGSNLFPVMRWAMAMSRRQYELEG